MCQGYPITYSDELHAGISVNMIANGRIRWAVDISKWVPDAPEVDYLIALLTPDEQQHCKKFKFDDDKKRAIVSRLFQRACCTAALGIPFNETVFKRTKGGKPYVANVVKPDNAPNFNFSVSHEGDLVVVATEPLCIVGCDVAAPSQIRRGKQQPINEFFKSFKNQFTPQEWASINDLHPDEEAMQAQFRRLWSLKEAYVKATGEGLGCDLGKMEVTVTGSTAAVTVQGRAQSRWRFHLHELGRGHWVSVAKAPLEAVVDAWGGFRGTFQRPELSVDEHMAAVSHPEPPFTLITVGDLLPPDLRPAYAAAGGDLL